jgi:hypothetical protein
VERATWIRAWSVQARLSGREFFRASFAARMGIRHPQIEARKGRSDELRDVDRGRGMPFEAEEVDVLLNPLVDRGVLIGVELALQEPRRPTGRALRGFSVRVLQR